MNFVKLHTTENKFNCECCGLINNSKIDVEILNNEDKISEKTFYYDDHFGKSNWNGEKTVIWAYILKELGYKLTFTHSLELYSDASDFNPQVESFYQEDSLQSIPVHIVYERDFYSVGEGKTSFTDQPKEFQIQLNGSTMLIHTQEFEPVYATVVKSLSQVGQFNVNPDFEFQEDLEY